MFLPGSGPPLEGSSLRGEVHYGFVPLDAEPSPADRALLDDQERARAVRFVRPADSRRFVAAHSALRRFLARYLDCNPADLRYRHSGNGKPQVAAASAGDIAFNLSHSGTLALMAVTRGRALGVDVERIRAVADLLAIADRYFSKAEAEALRALPPAEREAAFYRCWTRKEAVVKALGDGLGRSLDSFTVDLEPGAASALKEFAHGSGDRRRPTLRDLAAPAGYAAAGAAFGDDAAAVSWIEVGAER